jgi:hypothetical protein
MRRAKRTETLLREGARERERERERERVCSGRESARDREERGCVSSHENLRFQIRKIPKIRISPEIRI